MTGVSQSDGGDPEDLVGTDRTCQPAGVDAVQAPPVGGLHAGRIVGDLGEHRVESAGRHARHAPEGHLVLVGAGQQGDVDAGPVGDQFPWVPGKRLVAPHRVEGFLAAAGQVAAVRRHLLLGLEEDHYVHGHELVGRRVTQLVEELGGNRGALLGVEGVVGRSALGNGPVEQAVGGRHGQHVADAERPGGLAPDGDPVRVAAEGRHVLVHPGQGGHLVQRAVDPAGGEVAAQVAAQVAEPERPQPVVDGHHDDVAPCGERRAVVPGR